MFIREAHALQFARESPGGGGGVVVMTVGDVVMVTGCGGASVVQGGGRARAVPGVPSPAYHTLPRLLTWRPVERVRQL